MAHQPGINQWESELIPKSARLFMRVHKNHITDGIPNPGAFRNMRNPQNPQQVEGMSTDWNKYSTPMQTKQRATKDPTKNGVIEMFVGDVRSIPDQIVEHTPDSSTNNRAHTDVFGRKDTEVRFKYQKIYRWAIPLNIT